MSIHSNMRTLAGSASMEATCHVDLETLRADFARLVDETITQVETCTVRPDATFEGFGDLVTAIRSATTLEGTLLERGIARVASCNPSLVQISLTRSLPVHDAAKAVCRRNDWARASGLRLDSEVAARETYRPDLLLVDRSDGRALILDVKRAVASCKPRDLADLRSRMMAAALVTRDRLERDHDAPPVDRVEIAIIDGSGESRDETRGIFALTDLDWMLRLYGAADAMFGLRGLYATRIRELLARRCRALVGDAIDERRETVSSPSKDGLTLSDGGSLPWRGVGIDRCDWLNVGVHHRVGYEPALVSPVWNYGAMSRATSEASVDAGGKGWAPPQHAPVELPRSYDAQPRIRVGIAGQGALT